MRNISEKAITNCGNETQRMKLFQTPTSEKKNQWHILYSEDDRVVSTLCGTMGYWFGGYHNDKPQMTKENVKRCVFTGEQKLCPACVEQAYIAGRITILSNSKA